MGGKTLSHCMTYAATGTYDKDIFWTHFRHLMCRLVTTVLIEDPGTHKKSNIASACE
jgi:hypothetical protein